MKEFSWLLDRVRPYRRPMLAAVLCLGAVVFMELLIPRLIQRIIDHGILRQDVRTVVETALWMLGISAASTLLALGNSLLSVQVGERLVRDLREALFLRIQTFSHGNLDRLQTGELMVRLTSDTRAVQRLVQVSMRIGTRAPLLMGGSLAMMILTDPRLALALLPLLLLCALLILFFVHRLAPLFRWVQQKLDALNIILQENIAGARLVKAFVRADFEAGRFEAANTALTDGAVRAMRLGAAMSPVLTFSVNIGVVVVIWAGGLQSIRGELTVGQIVAFANYLLATLTPLTMTSMIAGVWARGIASIRRVRGVLETEPAVRDPADAEALPAPVRGRIVFEGVSFHFGGTAGEPVLSDIHLSVEPGQTVAILGATGAGKSALVNLVPRFYDATAGRVSIDGVDVRRIRRDALRAIVAVVPQESLLFSGTIRDNIAYGAPRAAEAEIVAAARAAQAHAFISRLPRGYDTPVAQRGASLSGGQRQRIAIARALVMNPRILVLDDSTSAVDTATENRIQEALSAWPVRHTRLVVAQRISTVLAADRIVVLDRGRIEAQGTHEALLQTSAVYREIFESQLGPAGLPPAAPGGEAR
jgi:ATP-binding cassette subfamily B protein